MQRVWNGGMREATGVAQGSREVVVLVPGAQATSLQCW